MEALKIMKTKDKMVKIQITEVILPYCIAGEGNKKVTSIVKSTPEEVLGLLQKFLGVPKVVIYKTYFRHQFDFPLKFIKT